MHDFTAALEGLRIKNGDDPESEKNMAKDLHAKLEAFKKRQKQ